MLSSGLFKSSKFNETCAKIENHFAFKNGMSEQESLDIAKKIQNNTVFITSSDFKYLESDGRQGKVYQIFKTFWDYDCFPYNASNMIPYPHNDQVLLVHADGTCTTHAKNNKTLEIDFTVSCAIHFDLDTFLKSIPKTNQLQVDAEEKNQISKTF